MHLTEVLEQEESIVTGVVTCEKGHLWYIENSIIDLLYPPLREEDRKWVAEYNRMAKDYDEAVKNYDDWLQIDMMKEREHLAQFLPNTGHINILDASIGTGANFIALENTLQDQVSRLSMHGLDVSDGMLEVCRSKFESVDLYVNLVRGNIFNMPFRSNYFHIVVHTGGLNTFSEKERFLQEMLRVAVNEGTIVVIDEGISPKIRNEERGRSIIEENSLFGTRPPLECLPEAARDVEVDYIMNDTFYRIVFKK
ncbi:class I SAM-dependent methyltransferase [Candidatus Thorarchaeota archaeon]|nr:MAG: class I SAM-dependent methyltransferase [Candidatus Thorarchaeota archaeon]